MGGQKPLGQILKELELVKEGQIQEALSTQRQKGGLLGDILIELGYIGKEELRLALAAQMQMELISLEDIEISPEVIKMISPSISQIYNIVPVRFEDNVLTIAMSNPHDVSVLDELRYTLHCEVKGAVASEDSINAAREKYYGKNVESMGDVLLGIEETNFEEILSADKKTEILDIEAEANKAPVVKLLNHVLAHAIKEQASDIHFEPFESDFKVRYRVDGVLYEIQSPPRHLASAIVTRIKVMAKLNISENRLPQDGRILLSIGNKPVDLRVSTLPTLYGESVVLRVLDRSVVELNLDNLGIRDDDMKLLKNIAQLPHGIVIVTGPTGSGKTTTLYSILNHLNDIKWKIITTEDPVEYDLDGIIQCPINEDIDVTFSNLLRTILRQDPDILLVGEIRDMDTADIAIEAALTGHLVFSTLHTNDAPLAITRLVDLGVEPYLICATIEAIVAQRLVKKICSNCKEEVTPTETMLIELSLTPDQVKGKKFCWGKGCKTCNNTGYKGRMAIYEIMLLTDKVKELIMSRAPTDAVRLCAQEQGMRTLRDGGLLAIYDGHTTIEEIVKETHFGG